MCPKIRNISERKIILPKSPQRKLGYPPPLNGKSAKLFREKLYPIGLKLVILHQIRLKYTKNEPKTSNNNNNDNDDNNKNNDNDHDNNNNNDDNNKNINNINNKNNSNKSVSLEPLF